MEKTVLDRTVPRHRVDGKPIRTYAEWLHTEPFQSSSVNAFLIPRPGMVSYNNVNSSINVIFVKLHLRSHSNPPGVLLQYSFGSVQREEPSLPLHSSMSKKG